MELLICAATSEELLTAPSAPLLAEGGFLQVNSIGYATLGVGIPSTFRRLPNILQLHRPARILNIGIAGAYPGSGLALGDIVMGTGEVYGDLGFELPDDPGFAPLSTSPFGSRYQEPFRLEPWANYDGARGFGCTVNACTGTYRTGIMRERLFGAAFETMEGAAIAQIGAEYGVPTSEIRAISNFASQREMRPDNIASALANLKQSLSTLFEMAHVSLGG